MTIGALRLRPQKPNDKTSGREPGLRTDRDGHRHQARVSSQHRPPGDVTGRRKAVIRLRLVLGRDHPWTSCHPLKTYRLGSDGLRELASPYPYCQFGEMLNLVYLKTLANNMFTNIRMVIELISQGDSLLVSTAEERCHVQRTVQGTNEFAALRFSLLYSSLMIDIKAKYK